MLPLRPPVEPMLATLARELPVGPGLRYEPKWDGFRCLAFVEDGRVVLQSRNGNDLTRYFPEVAAPLRTLPDAVLDGELLVQVGGRAEFSALLARLHPAASRVQHLAATTPACFVGFDVLAVGADDLTGEAFDHRRARLDALLQAAPEPLGTTPQTDRPDAAGEWLDAAPGSGLDGVVVKAADLRYEPGRRRMVKVKRVRTADLVVAGVRVHADGGVGSLLLGAYDDGVLRHVGVAGALPRARRAALREELAPLVTDLPGHPWELGFGLEGGALGRLKGTAGRWTPEQPRDWLPVRPDRVAEVAYDAVEGVRFRHPGRFLRWRPDRDAVSCGVDQLR